MNRRISFKMIGKRHDTKYMIIFEHGGRHICLIHMACEPQLTGPSTKYVGLNFRKRSYFYFMYLYFTYIWFILHVIKAHCTYILHIWFILFHLSYFIPFVDFCLLIIVFFSILYFTCLYTHL